MKFRTPVNLTPSSRSYSHADTFVSLGSCFAAEIGDRLDQSLFDCLTNPLGNLFNPLALAETLIRAIEDQAFQPEEFFEHQELWRHFLVHSSLASTQKEESLKRANSNLSTLRSKLLACDLLILTLGSAWVYQKDGYAGYIGHNHKLPASTFTKRRLAPDEISLTLGRALRLISKLNPELKICITVSPVRHTRDGLHENNLSKASLLLAVDQLRRDFPAISYFPAYELLLDELRDYRFFADDLTHPSKQATDYIWEKFLESYIGDACRFQIEEIETITAMLNHRPQHPDTQQYTTFKASLRKKIRLLATKLPRAAELEKRCDLLP
ncbi:GSCFA domain-containing protein [Pelagicoccus sp. SDUM812005]|uniref:GSCFA domain-containing protein n=1 Tax=Pelagicoccus sp. SDUM812005 TaxID=3041257 RepID=UPI002810061B|nr:GSCFA domain-containing protein [Pelagicoccus sp. SDUM812005]MDQ8180216.1 GSCFA domain-containing protein [Pelagicoccus sp. SDUM812005]